MAERRRASRKTAHEVQAAVEGVVIPAGDTRKVTLKGAEFRMADEVGAMPQITFGYYANSGVDSSDMAGLAAIYEMLRDSIDESEWERFRQHAVDTKASAEELMEVVGKVIQANAARPTQSPGGSSAGRRPISASSKASSPRTGTPPPDDDDGMVSVDRLMGR